MLRKTIVAMTAAATIGGANALTATEASARHGWAGGGFRVGHFGGYRHFGFRHVGFYGGPVYAYGYSCWRWVPTHWGARRVWAC
jgi:hypothetical protein